MATQTTLPLLLLALVPLAAASTFNVVNRCSYTVWGAASPGGGAQLNPGQSWTFNVADGTTGGRVWARTGCSFDSNGNGHCQTGDCGGVLACTGYGQNPNTLAEYALNQSGGLDYFDISLVAGFNVPLSFKPTSNGCTSGPSCAADINASCPAALRVPGGCDDPCTIFGTPEYCCPSGSSCNPTGYSKFFKGQCPQAFSYPDDYAGTTFTCPGNTNYQHNTTRNNNNNNNNNNTQIFLLPEMAAQNTLPLLLLALLPLAAASTFDVANNCSYTVWAAASPAAGSSSTRASPGPTTCLTAPPAAASGSHRMHFNSTAMATARPATAAASSPAPAPDRAQYSHRVFSQQPGGLDYFDISSWMVILFYKFKLSENSV
uniref:Protein P21-like n=1 Tax=Ananas comosus var. bracteatus TaxID=296719 RepID=A0A6V7NM20_ANACO|nr:unnamed protein product [Ananas comosus var. bracteatus]